MKFAKRKRQERKTDKARERIKRYYLWKFYRLTLEEQKIIRVFQAASPVYRLLLGKREGTDHCHKSGRIRGILDWRLNRALGMIEKVSPNNTLGVLRALVDYYENFPATQALGKEVYGLLGQAKQKRKMIYGG